MRNLKRVLSTLLAVAMLMGLVVFGASATKFSDDKDIVFKEAVDMATALNIINGYEDGTYKPDGTITRAEMCKMICMVMNGGNEPTLGVNTTATFTDIKGHWAEKYIEYCVAEGIVAGMGDGTFVPEGNVTGTQAAKMLLVALGYRATVEEFNTASWAVKINVRATQKKLFDKLSLDPNAALTRDSAAQMIWNALNACVVEYNYELVTVDGNLTSVLTAKDVMIGNTDDELSLMAQKFGSFDTTGIMTDISWNTKDKKFIYTIVDDAGVSATYKSEADYSDLFAMDVKVVAKTVGSTTTVFGIVADDSSVMATGIFDGMDLDVASDTSFTLSDTKINLDRSLTMNTLPIMPMYNYTDPGAAGIDKFGADAYSYAAEEFNSTYAAFEIRVIDVDGDNRADYIVYEPFSVAQVSSISSDNVNVKTAFGPDYASSGTATDKFSKNDDIIYDSPSKDDYVKIVHEKYRAYEGDEITLLDSVEIDVNRTKDGEVRGGDVWYSVLHKAATEDIKTDETWELFGVGSFAFFADVVEGVGLKDIVYIGAVDANTLGDRAKVYFIDGTSKTVDVDDWNDDAATSTANEWDHANAQNNANSLAIYKETTSGVKLTKISPDKLAGMDAYAKDTAAAASVTAKDGNKQGRFILNGTSYAIADDAVVFVQYRDGTKDKVRVYTGEQLRTMKEAPAAGLGNAILGLGAAGRTSAILLETVNGTNSVKAGFIIANAKPKAAGSTDYYGYILDVTYDEDGAYMDVWNGTTLLEDVFMDGAIKGDYVRRDVIKYTEVSSTEIDIDVLYTDVTAPYAAVTGTTKDGLSYTSTWNAAGYYDAGANNAAATFNYYDDDVVTIAVDSADRKTANASVDVADVVDGFVGADGRYAAANVRLIFDGGDIICVIYDVDNDFYGDPNNP